MTEPYDQEVVSRRGWIFFDVGTHGAMDDFFWDKNGCL